MADEDLRLWVNEQLNSGKSIESIKQSLLDSNYDATYVEQFLSEFQTNDAPIGQMNNNNANTENKIENIAEQTESAQENNETKNKIEESAFKIGIYSGATASIAMIALVYMLTFLDRLPQIQSYGFLIIFILTFIIANRSYNSNFKKMTGSVIISYTILVIFTIISVLFLINYMFDTNIFELYTQSTTLNNSLAGSGNLIGSSVNSMIPNTFSSILQLMILFVLSIIIIIIITLILRVVLKKINLKKINLLTPVLVIAITLFLGITIYSFTGETIPAYTEEIPDCIITENFTVCENDNRFEQSFKSLTGYTQKSYFLATPNTNNLFNMNKYHTHTTFVSMSNTASIGLYSVYLEEKFDENNNHKTYKNRIINNVDFKLDEIKAIKETEPIKAINLCFETYNSYLNEAKKLVSDTTTTPQLGTETKNANLNFIDNKIKTNIVLMNRVKYIEFDNIDKLDNTFYQKNSFSFLKYTISVCIDFIKRQTTDIIITNANIENQKITITVKNNGVYDYEIDNYNTPMIYLDGMFSQDTVCNFEQLAVNEEGTCTTTIRNNSIPKTIKFIEGRNSAEYTYEE